MLFGALFLASGIAAMVATFLSFNPVAGALRRAERRMQDATERERASRAELERAREALRQQENEREREDQRWRAARQQVVAEMLELQNYARTLMASKKGNPSVTDGLTGSAFYPLFTPANEVVPGEEAPPEMPPVHPDRPRAQPERRPSLTSRTAGLLSVLLAAALAAGCSSGEDAAGGGFSGGGGGGALSCPVPVGPLAFAVSGRSTARSRAFRRPSRTPRPRCSPAPSTRATSPASRW